MKRCSRVRKYMAQLMVGVLLLGGMTTGSNPKSVEAMESTMPEQTIQATVAKTQNERKEVTIYGLDETFQEYISIEGDYAQSCTLPGEDYIVVSGTGVTIEGNVIKPKAVLEYGYIMPGGFWVWSTFEMPAYELQKTRMFINFGDTLIRSEDGEEVLVHTKNYAVEYSQKVMHDYLEANITDSMTEYEKAEMCCKFVASYEYGTLYTSYTGMIITGAGDCIASTNTLIYMLNYLGIPAMQRDAANDPGAGNGHVNVITKLDGVYYVLDAGLEEPAPRGYVMGDWAVPYMYYVNDAEKQTISISTYMNVDKGGEVVVPSEINGHIVTEIAEGAFSGDKYTKKMVLPDTITHIRDSAFINMEKLQEIQLPAYLESIGYNVFRNCNQLKKLEIPASVTYIDEGAFVYNSSIEQLIVDENNVVYSTQDGVLFNKDQTALLLYPNGKKCDVYDMPDTVTAIGTWAFLDNNSIKELKLSENLKEVSPEAFYICDGIETLEIPDSMTEIQDSAFSNFQARTIILPDTLKVIGEEAFREATFTKINLPEGLERIEKGAFVGIWPEANIHIPDSVTYIGDYAFSKSLMSPDGASGPFAPHQLIFFTGNQDIEMGENVFDQLGYQMLCVKEGNVAYNYAVEHEIPYYVVNENGKLDIEETGFWLNTKFMEYTGGKLEPTVLFNPVGATYFMMEGQDYEVEYANNVIPGTAKAIIKGIGEFEGTVELPFTVTNFNGKYTGEISTDELVAGGDVNLDGKTDLSDAQLALKAALKIITLKDDAIIEADVDGNKSVTLSDAQTILKIALKIIK